MTPEKKYTDLYLASLDLLNEGMPSFVAAARREAVEMLNVCGFPGADSEYYRQTPMDEVFARDYEHYFTPGMQETSIDRLPVEGYEITIVNGFYHDNEPLRELPGGIIIGSMAAALTQLPELTRPCFNRLAGAEQDGAVALNTALAQDGAFVYVPAGVACARPIIVNNALSVSGEPLSIFCRNLFVAGEGSRVSIILNNNNISSDSNLISIATETFAAERAAVSIAEVQMEGESDTLLSYHFVEQGSDSICDTVSINLSGGRSRSNFYADLHGAGASNNTHGLCIASGSRRVDNYTHIRHLTSGCSSNEHFKGVVGGRATSVFNGRILVARDAQQTAAMQRNDHLLSGPEARAFSKPHLEIYADDVKCSHGSTVGQLDPAAVFYMRQRGLSEDQARGLQLKGFVCEVIDKIAVAQLQEYLNDLAAEKINRL